MSDNFIETARRMHESANTLHQSQHYHNACYLAGYVSECYLKIMVEQINRSGISSALPRSFGHRIARLNQHVGNQILSMSPGNGRLQSYRLDIAIECPSILNWTPEQRYEGQSTWDNESTSTRFQTEQEKCYTLISRMQIEGIIP